jgi:hypothetical protein
MIVYPPLPNGHNIKLLFTDRQLNEGIYPAMIRALKEGGFEGDGDWWKLLTTVAIGDTFSLNGPKYPNPKSYKPETMKDVFMLAERNLAHALMTAVFCKEVPYGCSPISFKEVYGSFKFDTHTAFRQATFLLQAENGSAKDLYRITIKGTGDDLSMHWFTFEPSVTWLCSRFPDTCRATVTTSTGEEFGTPSDSSIDSQVPPQQVALVCDQSAAATCRGGVGGGGCGGGPRLSAVSEPLVRDLKSMSEFVSNSGDFYCCFVQKPTRADMKTAGSKSTQKRRASARLAAAARP